MWEKFKRLKTWVVEKVLWAESELKGKTGAEKRAAVVGKLNEIVNLPWVPEWAEAKLIGWLVDLICRKLNILTDNNFAGMKLSAKQTEELVEALEAPTEMVISAASKARTVDERLAELCRIYGIETEETPKPETPAPEAKTEPPAASPKADPAPELKPGYMTPHFKRSEFACKCGCGADHVEPLLVQHCETIRQAAGMAVRINSGTRCEKHNIKVGGVPKNKDGTGGSFHLYGKAADLSCVMGARKLYELIQALYAAGKLPGLEYCIWYKKKNFVHIDIGEPRNQRFAVNRG